jgi:hypothetical protein
MQPLFDRFETRKMVIQLEEVRILGARAYVHGTYEREMAPRDGNFQGESTEVYDVVLFGSEGVLPPDLPVFEYGHYKGIVTLTGTVLGEEGTLEILFVGTSPGDIAYWTGTWRILSGTDDLANLHGQGTFESNDLMDIHYEGKVHFDPQKVERTCNAPPKVRCTSLHAGLLATLASF